MSVELITDATLLPLKHGFFTRRGGASSGIYAGLNCGPGSSDQSQAVKANRSRAAKALEILPTNLVSLHQIHSATVIDVKAPLSGPRQKADAMVTNVPGIALGVLSADCQPVLFADISAGVIGAAHAGWKGALDGVLGATVDAMEDLGADRSSIQATIGPCIGQDSYEVGSEFRQRFLDKDATNARFFKPGRNGKFQFDLPEFGLHQIRKSGVENAKWTGHCTYIDAERFYSYRRACHMNEPDYGRLLAAIRL